MELAFTERRVLITGVSRGIGLASTRFLLAAGAQVLGLAKDPERLDKVHKELSSEYPGQFWSHAVDLADTDRLGDLVDEVHSKLGGLDVLINNAGVMLAHGEEITTEEKGILEQTLKANLLAPYHLSRELLPLLRKGKEPRIIHVSSGAGTHHGLMEAGIASYRLSKWALNGFVMLQAKELKGEISVLSFDPGWVKTDLGGPNAPGLPEDSAQMLVQTLELPWPVTGKFYKGSQEIPW